MRYLKGNAGLSSGRPHGNAYSFEAAMHLTIETLTRNAERCRRLAPFVSDDRTARDLLSLADEYEERVGRLTDTLLGRASLRPTN
jgi:hypothetical protein